MVLREVRKALRRRLRSRALWAAFAFVVLANQPTLLYDNASTPALYVAWQEVLNGFFFFTFLWLAPVPFEWDGRPGYGRTSPRPLLQGMAASALAMSLLAWLDLRIAIRLHLRGNGTAEYLSMLCTFAPFLFLAGLISSRNHTLEGEVVEMHGRFQEAQTRHLQSQLHPHVLFNALNNLAELVLESPPAAYDCVRSMAGFLRRVLDASEVHDHALAEERALLEDYLAMEGQRFGARLQVVWEWDAGLDALPVTPLLLQPLVENALKHGISKLRGGGLLRIAARREGDTLRLTVANQGPPSPASTRRPGIGLKNLKDRLALAYGKRGGFELVREGEWTLAHLSLPIPSLENRHGKPERSPGG